MSGIVGRDILQIEGAEFPNSPTNEKNIGDNPWVEVHVGVSEAESVTVIERTGTYHTNTYDLATLMGPGGTFSTIADEYYTVTSDGNNLTIHCFRPNLDGGGNNIIATKLNGVPGVPDGIWATGIVDYALGTGGLRETRFNALGNHMQNHTRLGDDHSEIVLGYSYTYEVLPPENLTTRVLGPDIVLEWSPSVSFGIDYYRIYGGHSPRTIDLFDPIGSTQPGSLTTFWTHSGGALVQEHYYLVRAYNATYGLESYTSNTAGIFNIQFEKGRNPFSLPLEPFNEINVSELSDDILESIATYWMNSSGHWIVYKGPGFPDSVVEIGKGYMVDIHKETEFIFAGLPGSMVRHKDGFGFDLGIRDSLNATSGNDRVLLRWKEPSQEVAYYRILRSNFRDGFFKKDGYQELGMATGGSGLVYFTDLDPFSDSNEKYYLIVPVDNSGKNGSSSFSIAVVRMEFKPGMMSFGVPVKTLETHTVDSLSESNDSIIGVVYFIKGMWRFHAKEMPPGVYDSVIVQGESYQISVESTEPVKIEFIGI